MVISGNKWYSHILSKVENTLDYLIEIEGIDFRRAVETLVNVGVAAVLSKKPAGTKTVSIPERNQNDKRALAYLIKSRGIKAEIIIPLLKQGRICESAITHNYVFTGVDENNCVRYVMQRSTISESCLKFESEGSDKRYSFSLVSKSDVVCIFESPIDLLSYLQLEMRPWNPNHICCRWAVSPILPLMLIWKECLVSGNIKARQGTENRIISGAIVLLFLPHLSRHSETLTSAVRR